MRERVRGMIEEVWRSLAGGMVKLTMGAKLRDLDHNLYNGLAKLYPEYLGSRW